MKRIRWIIPVLAVFFLLAAGCQTAKTDGEKSPSLEEIALDSYNEGTEVSQYVKLTLRFDQPVKVGKEADKNMRITIADERMSAEITQADENTLNVEMPVQAITQGTLHISEEKEGKGYPGLTDSSGKYAVQTFKVDALVPSGVTLKDIEGREKGFEKEVEGTWNIRNITWLRFLENGEVVPSQIEAKSELLDGAVAVHGHDFLMCDETMIAQEMADTLNKHFGDHYIFRAERKRIIGEKLDGDGSQLDLEIYSYKKINGQTQQADSGEKEEQHTLGSKIKMAEKDREMTDEERLIWLGTHTGSYEERQDTSGEAALYETLVLTGDALIEEQVYAVTELEELMRLSFETECLNGEAMVASSETTDPESKKKRTFCGISLEKFLSLCQADLNDGYMKIICGGKDTEKIVKISDIFQKETESKPVLVFSEDGNPLPSDTGETQDENLAKGPLAITYTDASGDVQVIWQVTALILSKTDSCENPHYEMHNRSPHDKSKDIAFSVRVFREGESTPGQTAEFTTQQLEQFALDYPDAVADGYYGTIGNAESMGAMGIDGWLDYYRGVRLWWLLTEQLKIAPEQGSVEFYGRDGLCYSVLEDISYLNPDNFTEDGYYTMTKKRIRIPDGAPMIAFSKNGYPLLPEHEHESEGYHAYNQLNESLEKIGVSCELGVVKNQSGPFVACLGNLDGYYGGYRVETGGDCVRIDIHLK